MRKKLFRVTVLLIVITLLTGTVASVISYADGDFQLSLTRYFEYMNISISGTPGYIYNDGMFFSDANNLSEDMAKISVNLASAVYDKDKLTSAFTQMGFSTYSTYNYDAKRDYYNNDTVAYGLAKKEIVHPITKKHGMYILLQFAEHMVLSGLVILTLVKEKTDIMRGLLLLLTRYWQKLKNMLRQRITFS